MLPRIIALCGKRRSGKDTVADILCQHYGYRKVRIADPLKKMMRLLFGFTEGQLECDQKEMIDPKWGISPRQAMQFFGTDVMQHKLQELLPGIGRTFWVRTMIEKELLYTHDRIVISDLRFPHEVNQLAMFHPCIIRIIRPNIEKTDADGHLSETENDDIHEDICIANDGDLENLKKTVLKVIH